MAIRVFSLGLIIDYEKSQQSQGNQAPWQQESRSV